MKLIRLVLFLIAAAVGIAIAISNRQPVRLALEPFTLSIELPLFVVIFVCFLGGLAFGGFVVWWQDGRVRRRARRAEDRAGRLEEELVRDNEARGIVVSGNS